uniref:Uncharacterized protein n=1 Tax=Arundo donax TaxID=35708 RepID=A0A0A9BD61_ARUDO
MSTLNSEVEYIIWIDPLTFGGDKDRGVTGEQACFLLPSFGGIW